jgi:hypothetical protein
MTWYEERRRDDEYSEARRKAWDNDDKTSI